MNVTTKENGLPLISVIIPAYNAASTLEAACESVLTQDYGNVELVVVNDGSLPYQGTPHEVFQYGQELENMGLGVPQMTRVFNRLRAMGMDIDPSVYTTEQAKQAILAKLGKGVK